jgi:hypothetical protein
MELVSLFALAALAGAGFGALAAWWLLRSSGPVVTASALAELTRVRQEWIAWKLGADAMLEELEGVAQVVERRRARIAARESKASAGTTAQPASRAALVADLTARARAAGHPV